MQPPGLELPTDVRLPTSLTFRDASARDIYTALARFANLNIVFDPQFRDQLVTIDLRNASIGDALESLSTATRNFYRVTAQRTITLIPDTPAKRTEYEDEIVRTFYLSNADVKETLDLLRIVIDNRRLAPITATNALSIKDTPERVAAAARLIAAIDKARPEVVIDVELLEIDRTRLLEYGLQFASPGSPGINGVVDVNRENLTLEDLVNLDQSGVFLTNVPALFYRLLKTDSNTRVLANPQLRASEGMTASARFGERVPVPVTTFAPIATGGVAQQPITSFNYENIGVNIDIAPRTHHDAEVSLALKILVSSISGTGFGGLPTFGNREISTVIRLRDGETNLLAGLIRDDERRVAEGIPGLIDLPVIGRIFAHNRRETQETDIVLTLTPHVVRVLQLSEEDLRPFRVGRGAGGTGVIDLPITVEPPPAGPPPPPAAPPSQPPAAPAPAIPILPPAPGQPPPPAGQP
jgi:general secretion pathway protein D